MGQSITLRHGRANVVSPLFHGKSHTPLFYLIPKDLQFTAIMDPTGPAQPSQDTVYTTEGNPADQNMQESKESTYNAERAHNSDLVEAREQGDVPVPSTHSKGATSTSLGYGARDSSGDKTDVSV